MNASAAALLAGLLVLCPVTAPAQEAPAPATAPEPAVTPVAHENGEAPAPAADVAPTGWFGKVKREFGTVWKDGSIEVYVPFLTYHLPFWYTEERIEEFCQYPMGAGVGRGLASATGTWRGITPMLFLDSHCDPEPFLGYGWVKNWGSPALNVGLGYTAFITMRSDFNYIPLPGILPVFSFQSGPVAIQGTYLPGVGKDGNVLFLWAKLGNRHKPVAPVITTPGTPSR
jgi:palmitoyl transferase